MSEAKVTLRKSVEETNAMTEIGELLKSFWMQNNIKLQNGLSEKELQDFEKKYSVHLPDDLKDYFSTVNGFADSDVDENVITFLPLEEVVSLSPAWSRKPEADSYFIFADYSISCHVYAIQLTKDTKLNNPVFIAYDKNPIQIANSFSEFVEGYIADDYTVLFPQ